jgi:hypothetical protein
VYSEGGGELVQTSRGRAGTRCYLQRLRHVLEKADTRDSDSLGKSQFLFYLPEKVDYDDFYFVHRQPPYMIIAKQPRRFLMISV